MEPDNGYISEEEPEGTSELLHIGIKRESGRYPWGSGENPYQRAADFSSFYRELRKKNISDNEICEIITGLNKTGDGAIFKTPDLRAAIGISGETLFADNQHKAFVMKEAGNKTTAIAKDMGVNESTVRGWLAKPLGLQEKSIHATADRIREHLDQKEFLDVGKGSHLHLGVKSVTFDHALALLKDEGYNVFPLRHPRNDSTGNMIRLKVLTREEKTWHEARQALVDGKIRTIPSQSDDGGLTFKKDPAAQPVSIDLKRVDVKWAEQGGAQMDGVLELRRGVEDLSLGNAKYAQVRVAVNGTHYLKGMAMYNDDLPAGVDIRFNTNKSSAKVNGNKLDAMKPMKTVDGKVDADNPFGATTYPRLYKDKKGVDKRSGLNIVNEEGDWDKWSKNLSSQMLSKQSLPLAKTHLGAAQKIKAEKLKEIQALTNPVVKQKLLMEFAASSDAAAVHLKAAPFKDKDQSTHVLLPMNAVRPHEIYAPNFSNGDKVVLIRHPHGGPFEIPELTVNNHNLTARRIMGGAKDAVGIHHTVANQLSGADFDGDAVVVIRHEGKVKTRPPLKELANFDPKVEYAETEGMRYMTKKGTQQEMGKISNLITDMTIHGASDAHLARAVKHSMVVIDAEKHKLNYKLSAKTNNISQLKKLYQGTNEKGAPRGASTIISRASSKARIPHRKAATKAFGGPINKETGERNYEPTGRTYQKPIIDKKTGEIKGYRTEENKTVGKRLEFTKDAFDLVSERDGTKGTPMEKVYAEHSNTMKALANAARKDAVNLKMPTQSKAAKALYRDEVASLDRQYKVALMNAPYERRAQIVATKLAKDRLSANPDHDDDDVKRVTAQALADARLFTNSKKKQIYISDREWDAIQAGAVASSVLKEILQHADMDRVQALATPRPRTRLTVGQQGRVKQLDAMGKSPTQIAEALGIPRSTVMDQLTTK